jgi:plasmid stabilization system protein ParE
LLGSRSVRGRPAWARDVSADREEIFDYIAAENPAAAVKLDEPISERVHEVANFAKPGPGARRARKKK